jgi:glutathionylspermidine synthase
VKTVRAFATYAEYDQAWQATAAAGLRHLNVDAWASGRRYPSLASICLSHTELDQLRRVAVRFDKLLDLAVGHILEDPSWWSALAWPWPAIELARQEPSHPRNASTLFGRFDCLLDCHGNWQVIEYNADTPSGAREAAGLEPSIARLHGLRQTSPGLARRLTGVLRDRIIAHPHPVRLVGVVSSHSWLEDMAQATWLAWLLGRAGIQTIVGDVTDLATRGHDIMLRGRRIDALYRFYPIERLYRHAVFAPILEATIDGRLLLLNGLRGFLAQSKACLAWLWSYRRELGVAACRDIEQHLPRTLLARDPQAEDLMPTSVVKHVNGREGDTVVFGATLDSAAWEARLLEGGYVVQAAVESPAVDDIEVDDWQQKLTWVTPRYACVGAFVIGGRFGGCYTRLDGRITSGRATYVATLVSPGAREPSR